VHNTPFDCGFLLVIVRHVCVMNIYLYSTNRFMDIVQRKLVSNIDLKPFGDLIELS
jgi:hypothetical protein